MFFKSLQKFKAKIKTKTKTNTIYIYIYIYIELMIEIQTYYINFCRSGESNPHPLVVGIQGGD